MTVPGQFGTSLENQLRGHGFAIFPSDSSSGVRIGYVLDEIIGEITPPAVSYTHLDVYKRQVPG